MNDINIKIIDKIAFCPIKYLVSSNRNYRLVFEFDDEWADCEVKTARVLFGSNALDLVMTGNSVELPNVPVCERVYVGVFSDELASSIVEIGCITSVADSDSTDIYEFTQSQYDQIVSMLNDLDLRKIQSISRNLDNMIILYSDGTETILPLYNGVSVSNASVNSSGELIFNFSDGHSENCGVVKGEQGTAPSFSIGTVEQLNEGEDPYVTISGTSESPVLNFGLPKGSSEALSVFNLDDPVTTYNNLKVSLMRGLVPILCDDVDSGTEWYSFKCSNFWGSVKYIIFEGKDYEIKIPQSGNYEKTKIQKLPSLTSADNGKVLVVRDGEIVAQSPSSVLGS